MSKRKLLARHTFKGTGERCEWCSLLREQHPPDDGGSGVREPRPPSLPPSSPRDLIEASCS